MQSHVVIEIDAARVLDVLEAFLLGPTEFVPHHEFALRVDAAFQLDVLRGVLDGVEVNLFVRLCG